MAKLTTIHENVWGSYRKRPVSPYWSAWCEKRKRLSRSSALVVSSTGQWSVVCCRAELSNWAVASWTAECFGKVIFTWSTSVATSAVPSLLRSPLNRGLNGAKASSSAVGLRPRLQRLHRRIFNPKNMDFAVSRGILELSTYLRRTSGECKY